MGHKEIERDLAFIRQMMQRSDRYENIPPIGYMIAGLFGALAALGSMYYEGGDIKLLGVATTDLLPHGIIWGSSLFLSVMAVIFSSASHARKNDMDSFNSLAVRMLGGQIPQVATSGFLTIVLAFQGHADLIPAIWLLGYGIVAYGFSYHTGRDHLVLALVFFLFGVISVFVPDWLKIVLLGLAFGGGHIIMGALRWKSRL